MKNIYFLLFTICLCSVANAQSTFEKIIDTLGSGEARCVQQTFDGGYVYCGTSVNGNYDVIVVKLDSAGTIEWAKVYVGPTAEGAVHIEQTPDSGYIVDAIYDAGAFASKNWLLRLDVNGDTLWTKIFSAGMDQLSAYRLALGNIGNYGLTGYFKSSVTLQADAYLIVANDSGATQASMIYNTTYGSEGYGISKSFQNNYIITGAKASASSNDDLYLIKTDSIGDTLWTRSYDNSQTDVGQAVEQTSDSGFIAAGFTQNTITSQYNFFLVKTKQNGDTIWTKLYGGATSCGANSVQQTMDGGYIVEGRIVNGVPINSDIYLIKTDPNGDTLWTREFGGGGTDEGRFVRQTRDGGYILCGVTSMGNSGTYLIKTDSMGLVATGTGSAEINNPFSFYIYPNPSSGILTVHLKSIPYNNAFLEIYSMYNQSIYSGAVNNHSTLQIDLSNQPGGMYVVILRTKEKLFSKKIVIQK